MQDNKGWFPLMYAAQAGDVEICGLLVAYGANVHLTTYEGETIFDVCSHEVTILFHYFKIWYVFYYFRAAIDIAWVADTECHFIPYVYYSELYLFSAHYSYRLYWMKKTVIFVSNLHIIHITLISNLF